VQPDEPLPAFIARELGEMSQDLDSLLSERRAALLLDGLNEVLPAQRRAGKPSAAEGKDAEVQALINQLRTNPEVIAVITCREQDYTDLGLDRITIHPLDPIRIREFVHRYLGEVEGETLFWKLVGEGARALETEFRRDFDFARKLPNWQHVFWNATDLPGGGWWDWDSWLRSRDDTGKLLHLARNPFMLDKIIDVYDREGYQLPSNRGKLFEQFVASLIRRERQAGVILHVGEAKAFESAMRTLAYAMQTQRVLAKDGADAQITLDLSRARDLLSERQLYLGKSTHLLEVTTGVCFTYQLLQEYLPRAMCRPKSSRTG